MNMSKKIEEINIKTLTVGAFKTNCYIITVGDVSYIIDPGSCCEEIIGKIRKLKVKYILLTHSHTDHVSCAKQISDRFNCPIFLDEKDKKFIKLHLICLKPFYPEIPAKDFKNSISKFSDNNIELIYIPGHTTGGTCFYFKKYNIIFSGDTIFYKSIGRTDFPNSNQEQLIQAIKNNILTLPDHTIIYPGHGKSTTVGYEKKNNPFFR
jgi:hydroxyacylglutathione hydrolase